MIAFYGEHYTLSHNIIHNVYCKSIHTAIVRHMSERILYYIITLSYIMTYNATLLQLLLTYTEGEKPFRRT